MIINNNICPYCTRPLVDGHNLPNKKSVEHLIPNNVLSQKRTKRDGDFYACRDCNCKKGHMDFILGVISRINSNSEDISINTLKYAITHKDKIGDRFRVMVSNAIGTKSHVSMTMPIRGEELIKYIKYLGKGQYYRVHRKPFSDTHHVMIIGFSNKEIMSFLEKNYQIVHKSSPFEDLRTNKFSENYSDGECIIYSKNDDYLFLFHNYTAIIIQIKRKNKKNTERSKESEIQILMDFPDFTKIA